MKQTLKEIGIWWLSGIASGFAWLFTLQHLTALAQFVSSVFGLLISYYSLRIIRRNYRSKKVEDL